MISRRNMVRNMALLPATTIAACGVVSVTPLKGAVAGSSASPTPPPIAPPSQPQASGSGAANIGALYYIDDYGQNTQPGITPMDAAVQAAYDAAIAGGGGTVVAGPGPYLLTAPINCTSITKAVGVQFLSFAPARAQPHCGLMIGHSGIGIDCTGNGAIQFTDVSLTTAPGITAQIGILYAPTARNMPFGRLIRPSIVGSFSVAGIYNYGAELFYIDGGYCMNTCTGANARCAVFTVSNVYGVDSSVPGLIATGNHSMTVVDSVASSWVMINGASTADCIALDGVAGFNSYGDWCINPTGRSMVYFDGTNNSSSCCNIQDLRMDVDTNKVQHGILFGAAPTERIYSGIKIHGVRFVTSSYAIAAADANTVLDALSLADNTELNAHGLYTPGRVQGSSTLRTGPMPVSIAQGLQGSLIEGNSANWNIGGYPNSAKIVFG